ncbi:hypothetical protein F2P81_008266 [Scophthalmus maximus]|uniref:Uncharacterized protein n=1 Tax=Scophthalmus maximus TaxID=52904 RepID=A0A6A4TAR8_SCOMX|nr:hypothetical protein F2P81_008266 [Scophthalmus maximus]
MCRYRGCGVVFAGSLSAELNMSKKKPNVSREATSSSSLTNFHSAVSTQHISGKRSHLARADSRSRTLMLSVQVTVIKVCEGHGQRDRAPDSLLLWKLARSPQHSLPYVVLVNPILRRMCWSSETDAGFTLTSGDNLPFLLIDSTRQLPSRIVTALIICFIIHVYFDLRIGSSLCPFRGLVPLSSGRHLYISVT